MRGRCSARARLEREPGSARTCRSEQFILLLERRVGDPLTFAAMPIVLSLVALAASAIPAYRATTVDPVTALRQD